MFDFYDYIYNENGILREIKYKKSELKNRFHFVLFICAIGVIGALFFILMHLYEGMSIGFLCVWLIVVPPGLLAFVIIHLKLVKFRLFFNQEGLQMIDMNKRFFISYKELEAVVIMHRVGASNNGDMFTEGNGAGINKVTICFLKDENINLSKLKRKISTNSGIDHGFYKGSFYLGDYRGSKLIEECKKTIEYFYPCNIKKVSLDRDQL